MKTVEHILIFFCCLFIGYPTFSQEEQSAELFLEEYTDEFQENFFEALKQKGIENYDKAINLFLACKNLDSANLVIDHELAKAYLADKKLIRAQEYAITCVNAQPENQWYLDTLVAILLEQGANLADIKGRMPYENNILRENLALIFFKRGSYQEVLQVLDGIKKTPFTENLRMKVEDQLALFKKTEQAQVENRITPPSNPLLSYRQQLSGLIDSQQYSEALSLAETALETYPSQPFFYYAQGLALSKTSRKKEAIEVLESGLDYLIDDTGLANKMYKELASCHRALGNPTKANEYLSKIKSGS